MSSEPIYTIPPTIVHTSMVAAMNSVPWTRKPEIMKPIWDAGITGRECIGINLDTGYKKHPLLPSPLEARNFTTANSSDVEDRHGHGSHCIGSMMGRNGIGGAPEAKLKVGKVLGDSGGGSNTTAGLEWAAQQAGDVVSCSWGSSSQGSVDSRTEAALKRIEDSGKWVLFAAGNEGYRGWDSVGTPADSPHCLAVTSIDAQGKPSSFTSGGPRADVAAGGSQILSCGIREDLVFMSGTSMACPTLGGDMLLLRQVLKMLGMTTAMTSRGLVKFLSSESFLKDAGAPGRDPLHGEGITVTSEMILSWIAKKLSLVIGACLLVIFCSLSALAQPLLSGEAILQAQVVFQDAKSAEVTTMPNGRVAILSEGLSETKQFGVRIEANPATKWLEVHDVEKPFPPVIEKPFAPGKFLVRGKLSQKFAVSLRGLEQPHWFEVVVGGDVVPKPDDPPPPVNDDVGKQLQQLSASLAEKLKEPHVADALHAAIVNEAARQKAECQAGRCPTISQSMQTMSNAISEALLRSNGKGMWYQGWRQPISEAIKAKSPGNAETYLSLIVFVAKGLK